VSAVVAASTGGLNPRITTQKKKKRKKGKKREKEKDALSEKKSYYLIEGPSGFNRGSNVGRV
jgi:hypothetical protein